MWQILCPPCRPRTGTASTSCWLHLVEWNASFGVMKKLSIPVEIKWCFKSWTLFGGYQNKRIERTHLLWPYPQDSPSGCSYVWWVTNNLTADTILNTRTHPVFSLHRVPGVKAMSHDGWQACAHGYGLCSQQSSLISRPQVWSWGDKVSLKNSGAELFTQMQTQMGRYRDSHPIGGLTLGYRGSWTLDTF